MWENPGGEEAVTGGGRLDGVRVAVKDLVAVAGVPLRAGTLARADAPPEPQDATVVAQLRAAGATITGTVGLHEIAFGTTGVNDQVGFEPNPHDPERIPGGSSSGSAVAVAEGRADLAVGTDTGGSVRIPAALCGVVGLKPSYERYSRHGVLALSPSLDHVGLLAPTVDAVAAGHRALTGEAAAAPATPGRLGVDRTALTVADDEVATAVDRALAALHDQGWALVDVTWPDRSRVQEVTTIIMFAEAAAAHRLLWQLEPDRLGPDVLARLQNGAAISQADYDKARADAAALRYEVAAQLAAVDAVAGPTVPVVAPTIDAARADPTLPVLLVSNTRLANVTGFPALTLPVPSDGLPVGLQLVASADDTLLGIAKAAETVSWQAGEA